jgi:hypothetical protein
MLRLVTPDETPINTTPRRDVEAEVRAEQNRINATRAALAALRPAWAKALIVAELEHDASDSMTDYFNTTTSRHVALAWSAHTRDLFLELRKAAAKFPATSHLGPGCDRYTACVVLASDVVSGSTAYWKDSPSHWHRELDEDGKAFITRAAADAFLATAPEPEPIQFGDTIGSFRWRLTHETIEHREKYSMGHGYYLKAAGRYHDGWMVRKIDAAGSYTGALEIDLLREPSAPEQRAASVTRPTITINAEKSGVEIRFPSRPADAVLQQLKAHGWRWSRFAGCWYHRDTPDARVFADTITAPPR